MTDLEAFLALYARFGVHLKVVESADAKLTVALGNMYYGDEHVPWDKWDGYGGFFSTAVFDKDGAFLSQGFWE